MSVGGTKRQSTRYCHAGNLRQCKAVIAVRPTSGKSDLEGPVDLSELGRMEKSVSPSAFDMASQNMGPIQGAGQGRQSLPDLANSYIPRARQSIALRLLGPR